MFNVTVLKLKDLIKILCVLIIIYILYLIFTKENIAEKYLNCSFNLISDNFLEISLNSQSNIIKFINESNDTNTQEFDDYEKDDNEDLFSVGSFFKVASNLFIVKEAETKYLDENNSNFAEETNDETTIEKEADIINTENILTEVVTENPVAESYTTEYNGVKIKNSTSYELTEDILNADNLSFDNKNIIIFHTHTCESYTQTENYTYESSGNYRTTDLNYSVARVGDELTSYLEGYGFNIYHDKTYHDYPSYTGSYSRSLQTVQNILQTFSSDIIIDLHRDALGSDETYAPLVKIGDDYCAQLMFVIGTDGGGLSHPNWDQNLKFAIKIQEKANELFPGLFKPIVLRNSRYNQHLAKAACIIEVGATGNTMEQTLMSMKYLSYVINEVLNAE